MTGNLLCLGYGYTAEAFARRLAAEGWRIAGTARTAEKASRVAASGATPVLWGPEGVAPDALEDADAILVSTPPDAAGCPALRAAGAAIAKRARAIKWVGYLSTNGVYGDHKGAWIDESAPLLATSPRGLQRIAAEADWAGHGVEWSYPLVVFRLPGIYGPGRSALDQARAGEAKRIFKEGQVFNRMHVDDIAAVLAASLAQPLAGDLFNLSDDEPAPPQDVVEHACALLGLAPPPLTPFEDAALSEMGRSFYAENKRVRNDRIKTILGVTLRYPSYREGLAGILAAEQGPRG